MKRNLFKTLLIAGLASAVPTSLVPRPAGAQTPGDPNVDSDSDGVNDALDAQPCDARVSARVYAPADRTYGMLIFEDQWPARGDFDFNDVVIAYNEVLRYDSSARVTGLRLNLTVMAVGARYANGLAIRLPGTPRSSVTALSYQISNVMHSIAGEVTLRTTDSEAVFDLSDDLHALFGVQSSRSWVNTDPSQPMLPYVDMVVDIQLDPGVSLSAADAPFDIFLFDRARGIEVHRPRYNGTAALNASLFNTGDDGSTAQRRFVNTAGIPFALELPELANYPREGVGIDALYPAIVQFGGTAGAQATDFFRNPSPGAAFGMTQPRTLEATAAADVSCFAPSPGVCGSAVGTGHVNAPTLGLCSAGTPTGVTTSSGLFRWSCSGSYSLPTACTAPDWVCQPNIARACSIGGGTATETCNGSGSGYGACTLTACNAGYYQSGNSCIAQVCAPGSNRSCSIANGSGAETCDNLGSAYGACTVQTCNSGYERAGNTCVPTSSPGTPGVPWAAAPQLYCNGGCSWDSEIGCGQGDANIFCRLRTGNASSYATSYTTGTALPLPGFSCPSSGVNLGSYPQFGGPRWISGQLYTVWAQSTSILANHGPGVVITSVTCAP